MFAEGSYSLFTSQVLKNLLSSSPANAKYNVAYTFGVYNDEIIKSITKKYRKEIWSRFNKAIKEFELIKENDKIMVCISGGKDSMLLAKCLEELKRHSHYKFDLEYVVMNPGYNEKHSNNILENAKVLNIPIKVFKSDIFEVVDKISFDSPCYMCAKMRRGYLYNKAKELGCNKIALGHHFNDVIETSLLNIIYAGRYGGMPPKLRSDNFSGMELIRPLYLVKEDDIISFANYNNLEFIDCACLISKKKNDSKRKYIKELIKELVKDNKNADINIFRSLENVNLDTLNGYIKNDLKFNFNDLYKNK